MSSPASAKKCMFFGCGQTATWHVSAQMGGDVIAQRFCDEHKRMNEALFAMYDNVEWTKLEAERK